MGAWKIAIPQLKMKMQKDEPFFMQVYTQAFDISQEPGLKNIDQEIALILWPIFMKDRCKFLTKWLKFIENNKDYSIIKRDQWMMFYELNA